MAGNSRIVATILGITHADGQPENEAQFLVQYYCTGPVGGAGFTGMALLVADVVQNEEQITIELRGALADEINPLVSPPQNYSANDVRGLNI